MLTKFLKKPKKYSIKNEFLGGDNVLDTTIGILENSYCNKQVAVTISVF
jgi:hypothetical protein